MKSVHNFKGRGSALFLVLIAVALFAALAYAVTQAIDSKGDVAPETVEILHPEDEIILPNSSESAP